MRKVDHGPKQVGIVFQSFLGLPAPCCGHFGERRVLISFDHPTINHPLLENYWAEAHKHIKIQMMLARQDQLDEKNRKWFLSILSFPFLSYPILLSIHQQIDNIIVHV
jgi:hypothetical protein